MRDMMWIYVVIIFFVSEAWSMEPGTNQSTSMNSSTCSLPLTLTGENQKTFCLGCDANLTCSNKTWNETIFVIWKINMTKQNKCCTIGFNSGIGGDDSCKDGKSLRNTSRSQSYLHIANFSTNDVGVYYCELAFKGGVENYLINVDITVPPRTSAWLEDRDKVAVCKAEEGKPAANISWSYGSNLSSVLTRPGPDGSFTVESRLELTEGMDPKHLTCIIRHLFWKEKDVVLGIKRKKVAGYFPWVAILVVLVVFVLLMGFLYFAQKKLMLRRCQQSDTSPSKSPPTEDVEEVEPYASYVQRVNSIYN
ncbi:cell surface glycoprotein CD200 receptor 1-B isoform X1 [Lates calcarifer]|uniref:Cell surface glycoprotein CD200 receptor 1-B isoform X1 n=2 Tax=Lates calcarifer TaxID=8187 RepID=A0AAJ7PNW0_LATCA|nr:cell surface glycoprotein CD200 receptor 1-B isoform X1 [Lates calcarifer]